MNKCQLYRFLHFAPGEKLRPAPKALIYKYLNYKNSYITFYNFTLFIKFSSYSTRQISCKESILFQVAHHTIFRQSKQAPPL